MRRIAILGLLLAAPALAQSPGTLNLIGPSSTPGAPQVTTVATVNAAVNAALAAKADATGGVLTSPAITGGTIAGTPISGAPGAFTTFSASGAVTGAGITTLLAPYAPLVSPTFSGNAIFNTTSLGGYQQNGSTVLNQTNVVSGSTSVGAGAGTSLPAGSIFSVFIGYQAGNAFNGSQGEVTCVGTLACPLLQSGGTFSSAFGEHAMGHEVAALGSTALGNDANRDYVSIGANTAVGKNAMASGGGNNNIALGFNAMYGNAGLATITGSATNGDVVTLTFTGSFTGSPHSQQITVTAAETTTQMATALTSAVNGDSVLLSNAFLNTAAVSTGNVIHFQWPGTATTGSSIVVTASITGSATETVTIGGGVTGTDNVAIGKQAIYGYNTLTTANNDIGIGSFALPNLSTGSGNIGIGSNAGGNLTTGPFNTLMGISAGNAATTVQGLTALGYNAGLVSNTTSIFVGYLSGIADTGNSQTIVGPNAGLRLTTGANNTGLGANALQGASGSTLSFTVGVGDSTFAAATTASQGVAIGSQAGSKVTSGNNNVFVGPFVGSTTLTTGDHNLLIGVNSSCDTAAGSTTSSLAICGANGAYISATGTDTPSTSVVTLAGTLNTVGGYKSNGTAGVACSGSPTASFASVGGIVTHC